MNDMSNERRPAACKVFWNSSPGDWMALLSPIGAYAMYLFDEYQQLRQENGWSQARYGRHCPTACARPEWCWRGHSPH